MIKYLYGKSVNFQRFINGEAGLRFCAISNFAMLENIVMRDDELRKKLLINPNEAQIKINDTTLQPKNIVGDVEITLPVMNSYCLCLSNRKDSAELYKKFNADICMAIDVELLVASLKIIDKQFPGTNIEHGNVTYFDPSDQILTSDPEALAFYKPKSFIHESEYRVLIRFPKNRSGFKTEEGLTVPIFINGEEMHLWFEFDDKTRNNAFLVETYHPSSLSDA